MVTRNLNTDPVRNFRFRVNIPFRPASSYPSLMELGFMSVSGLAATTEPISYREGGLNTTPRKMPGQTDFPPLSLTRGVVGDPAHRTLLWQWYRQIFVAVQGSYGTGTNGVSVDFRTEIDIIAFEHPTTALPSTGNDSSSWTPPVPAVRWHLYNAWPASIAFSDLDAGGNGIIVNNMTLMYEGFDVFTGPLAAAA